ncbi:hypothetical protein CH380_19205 [Leptospira adleri]|uniref:Uncharacterized protein n=2 Tax=Leptospira adleri TaxID=2023186 RepID=A0A2M9YJ54_9LEPT|nr:hypothetical protein CH380_19205 [Leptospira adleri]PJZ61916.1 hypothetical protein CH376_10960 [Leptospira adleri]
MIHAISPSFRVFLFGFLPDNPAAVSKRYSAGEILALKSPIEIPKEFLERVNFNDRLEGGSFRIDLPKGARNEILVNNQRVRVRELFRPGRIIVITENEMIKFAGRISESDHEASAKGDSEYGISGEGLEEAISSQILFIDFDNAKPVSASVPAESASKSPASRLQIALQVISNAIKETKSPTLMLKSLANSAIEHLLSNGSYGGNLFSKLVETSKGLDSLPYTTTFLHTLQWINSQTFGNSLSIWSLMESLAKAPLYELFFHYDQAVDFYISETLPFLLKKLTKEKISSPDLPLATLVYRKTPFEYLDTDIVPKGLVAEVEQSLISGFRLSESSADIFSGVHINVGIFDNITGLTLNPVTYSPSLLAEFGQRVLSIVLDGTGFPQESQDAASQSVFKEKLNSIQSKIFNTFGTGERIFSGSFSGGYFREISKGMIMEVVNKNGEIQSKEIHKELEMYDPKFYVTGIDVTWVPGAGIADQTISVKWGKRKLNPNWDKEI